MQQSQKIHEKGLAEIKVRYSSSIARKDRIQIRSSEDAYKVCMKFWDLDQIEYKEFFYAIMLNRANQVLGFYLVSTGGKAGTVVDVSQLLGVALKTNSSGIILAHNHPSGNLSPSGADQEITSKILDAAKILNLKLLDHLIICPNKYISFADEGYL